ncbi:hypothetical protein Pla52o_15750 [Novipirellula galeiformis]|uniref:Uncharacterized protein n=1 Tax=Novipirellula galeiformis TaxID=2528004 RepID=A0A5C6CNU2_9BACT|nr:hypothetical protein [Novipirellula galeiformis]TWU25277.1 hypothetical protein Pla52o_15750 [Novipirellula galeiformis]
MKRLLCLLATASVALTAIAADPQSESESKTQDDGKGNSSWSHSYSNSWGDQPPMAGQFGDPGWNWMGPPTEFNPMTAPPMPNFNHGFYPGWNMPMPGGPGQQYASSTRSNSMSISGASVLSALGSLQFSSRLEIRLTVAAAEAIQNSEAKVSISEVNKTPVDLANKMLSGTGCEAQRVDDKLVIHKQAEKVDAASVSDATQSLNTIMVAKALKSPVTLTMQQTPLPFVTQMLQGMTGVTIELPEANRSFFYTPQPRIDVNANQTPLSEVLESVAKQIDAELDVSGGRVRLRSKDATTN